MVAILSKNGPLFKNGGRGLWITLFLIPALIMFGLIFLWPLGMAVVTSFFRWNGFESMVFIGLSNYIELAGDPRFIAAMSNTLTWAAAAAFIHVPFGVMVALILSKKLIGWRFVRSAFMVPNIIAPSAMAILFLFVFRPEGGILNSFLDIFGLNNNINWLFNPDFALMALTQIWLWYAAVIVLITLAELLSIPPELYEAAKIDGANVFQIDMYINIPLLKRIIGTGIIIAVTSVLKTFDIIFMTTNGGPGNSTVNLAIMSVNAIINQNRHGYANAIGIVLLLLGVVVMGVTTKVFRMNKSAGD